MISPPVSVYHATPVASETVSLVILLLTSHFALFETRRKRSSLQKHRDLGDLEEQKQQN
jgi:hypothetical protein